MLSKASPRFDEHFFENLMRDCGKMLIQLANQGGKTGFWDGDQFKANADVIAHEFICSRLLHRYPNILILSEEDLNIEIPDDGYFLIDPIDGTASYAQGFPGWVTQIAFMSKSRPLMACVYAPVMDEYFFSIANMGAYRNGEKLNLTYCDSEVRVIIDNYPEPKGITLDIFNDFKIQRYIESGSLSLKICRVADGTADLFIKDMSPRDWDLAAPTLILEEAGGLISDMSGCEFEFGKSGLVHNGLIAAPNKKIFENVVRWCGLRK